MATKYVTAPNVEATGMGMMSYFDNVQAAQIAPIITPVLQKYGYKSVKDIKPDEWYPVQISLDIFKVLEENRNATVNLVAIGMRLVQDQPVPEYIQTIPQALELLNTIYDVSIRNFPESEKYDIAILADTHVRLIDNSPYPHDLIYGFIYGLSRRYAPAERPPTVIRTFQNPDTPNAAGAVYDVTW